MNRTTNSVTILVIQAFPTGQHCYAESLDQPNWESPLRLTRVTLSGLRPEERLYKFLSVHFFSRCVQFRV